MHFLFRARVLTRIVVFLSLHAICVSSTKLIGVNFGSLRIRYVIPEYPIVNSKKINAQYSRLE
jgi:hypothetical protein